MDYASEGCSYWFIKFMEICCNAIPDVNSFLFIGTIFFRPITTYLRNNLFT